MNDAPVVDTVTPEPEAPRRPVACRNKNCRMFGELVTPEPPRGVCPFCKTALPGSTLSKRFAIDQSQVARLSRQYQADYGAATQYARDLCDELAAVNLTIKKIRRGSAEHQRLHAIRRDLRAELESLASRAGPADSLEELTDSELIALAVSILRRLLAARDGAVATPDVEEAHALLAQAASVGG